MVAIAGDGLRAIKGVVPICLAAGGSYVLSQLVVSFFLGPELAGVAGAICTMGTIIGVVKLCPPQEDSYVLKREDSPQVSKEQAFFAWLPFVLIFVLLLLTSKLVPAIYDSIALNLYPVG